MNFYYLQHKHTSVPCCVKQSSLWKAAMVPVVESENTYYLFFLRKTTKTICSVSFWECVRNTSNSSPLRFSRCNKLETCFEKIWATFLKRKNLFFLEQIEFTSFTIVCVQLWYRSKNYSVLYGREIIRGYRGFSNNFSYNTCFTSNMCACFIKSVW